MTEPEAKRKVSEEWMESEEKRVKLEDGPAAPSESTADILPQDGMRRLKAEDLDDLQAAAAAPPPPPPPGPPPPPPPPPPPHQGGLDSGGPDDVQLNPAAAAAEEAAVTPPGGPPPAPPTLPPPPGAPPPGSTAPEPWFRYYEEEGLTMRCITNSGETQDAIWIVSLKNLFAKQLPNMPKEYIVRLLMDRNHESMIALRNDVVVGGVTFRTFKRQLFAEIAFCAVTASEQVKGYGTRLMNHVKEFSRERHGTTHFLTYADNNAVGYFVKQGFSKEILFEREKWHGYIKDYDGGTMMECALSHALSYTDFPKVIRDQRQAVDTKLRQFSSSHIVYPGLKFSKGMRRLHPSQIPGLLEAGWAPSTPPYSFQLVRSSDLTLVDPSTQALHTFMREVHESAVEHPDSWPFLEAVDVRDVPDYPDIIKDPVDLSLIKRRLATGDYYITLDIFAADFLRMFENCRLYNAPDTIYYKCATKLEQHFEMKMASGVASSRGGY